MNQRSQIIPYPKWHLQCGTCYKRERFFPKVIWGNVLSLTGYICQTSDGQIDQRVCSDSIRKRSRSEEDSGLMKKVKKMDILTGLNRCVKNLNTVLCFYLLNIGKKWCVVVLTDIVHPPLSEDFGNKCDFFVFRTKSTVIPVLQVRKIEAQKLYMPDF